MICTRPNELKRMIRIPYASAMGSVMYVMICTRPDELKRIISIQYVSAIGSIMYVMIYTQPNVVYALRLCSRFQANPGEAH